MPAALAALLVFFTSAAVLVLEILAGRLLAPYVGVTLETFTGIIGTVLAGISMGSWLGGRLADRVSPRKMLGPLLVSGGILALLAPPIVSLTGPRLSGGEPLEIVVLAFLGFFAPALVLSAITPTVVKIRLGDLAETGTVVGRLSAIGTAGAIFGTFVTGFLLLAALPSRPIVLAVGGALVIAGFALWRPLPSESGAVAVWAAIGLAAGAAALTALTSGPCERETAYFCAKVTVDPQRESGRILWLDTLRHSYVDLEDPTYLGFRYAGLVADTLDVVVPPGPIDVVYIGGGGFTLPRYIEATRPGSTALVLELDPTLVDLAEDELGLMLGNGIEASVGDARLTLLAAPESHFEVAVGDAFGGPSVPWHLTTREFLEEVRARLTPDGVYIMNLIDYPPLRFARSETATLRDVFDHVAVIAPAAFFDRASGGNFVLVGSDTPIDAGRLSTSTADRGGIEITVTDDELDTFVDGARVLTDDYAPVDQLISRP